MGKRFFNIFFPFLIIGMEFGSESLSINLPRLDAS
jgi:hypothetical protein